MSRRSKDPRFVSLDADSVSVDADSVSVNANSVSVDQKSNQFLFCPIFLQTLKFGKSLTLVQSSTIILLGTEVYFFSMFIPRENSECILTSGIHFNQPKFVLF
jgi:hypothetical protein